MTNNMTNNRKIFMLLIAVIFLSFSFFLAPKALASVNPCVNDSNKIISGISPDANGDGVPTTGPSSQFPMETAFGQPATWSCNTCSRRDVTMTGRICSGPAGGSCTFHGGCCALSPVPTTINEGDSAALNWINTVTAATGSINPGAVAINPTASGSASVSPSTTTTFTMTVTGGPLDNTTCSTTVTVVPAPAKCTITVSPSNILQGESTNVNVSWTTQYATAATLNGTSVAIGSGNKTFTSVSTATSYNLNVTGNGPAGNCSASINIIVPPTGSLVPCGRLADNPATTDIVESNPCTLCALFYMLKNVINFVMTLSIGIGVFILILSGLLYAFSAGDSGKINKAKSAITSAVIGIAIVFLAWLVIAAILQGMGYANMGVWNQVSC